MSLIVAPPVAWAGDPAKALRKRKTRVVSILLANTIGSLSSIKAASVTTYIVLRPIRGAFGTGNQSMGPIAYPRSEREVPRVATTWLTPNSFTVSSMPGE